MAEELKIVIDATNNASPTLNKVREQLQQLERTRQALNRAMESGDRREMLSARRQDLAARAALRNIQAQERAVRQLNKVNEQALRNIRRGFSEITTIPGKFMSAMTFIGTGFAVLGAGAYGAFKGINKLQEQSRVLDKLGQLSDVGRGNASTFYKQLGTQASNARMDAQLLANQVYKSEMNAPHLFKGNAAAAVDFWTTFNKLAIIGGSTTEERNSAQLQLMQALGANVLQGDEARSIRENAPLLEQFILQEMRARTNNANLDLGGLKQLQRQGKITGDVMVEAMKRAKTSADRLFVGIPKTIEEASLVITNKAKTTFSGVWKQIGDIFQHSPELNRIVDSIMKAMNPIAVELTTLFRHFSKTNALGKFLEGLTGSKFNSKNITQAFQSISHSLMNTDWKAVGQTIRSVFNALKTGASAIVAVLKFIGQHPLLSGGIAYSMVLGKVFSPILSFVKGIASIIKGLPNLKLPTNKGLNFGNIFSSLGSTVLKSLASALGKASVFAGVGLAVAGAITAAIKKATKPDKIDKNGKNYGGVYSGKHPTVGQNGNETVKQIEANYRKTTTSKINTKNVQQINKQLKMVHSNVVNANKALQNLNGTSAGKVVSQFKNIKSASDNVNTSVGKISTSFTKVVTAIHHCTSEVHLLTQAIKEAGKQSINLNVNTSKVEGAISRLKTAIALKQQMT